jgi:membrane protein required for colicin V production
MTSVDYILIGIFALSALLGLLRGLLREVLTIVTWLIALWLAWRFADVLLPYLGTGALSKPPVNLWAARGLMFLGIMLIGTVITAVVAQIVRASLFSGMDRFLGFVFGLLRGALIVGVLVMLAQRAGLNQQDWWQKSKLMPYGEAVAALMGSWVGERIRTVAPAEST